MNFVNDVDLIPRAGRGILAGLTQLAHLLHAVVAGAVNLEHIERPAFGNFHTTRVIAGEVHFRSVGAIEALGENAGDGGLARAARAAKQVGVGYPLSLNGMGERLRDVLLSHDILEALRPVFTGNDLITHSSAEFGVRSAE